MNKLLLLFFFLISNHVCSACTISPGGNVDFSFGNVIVQRDTPVGATISKVDIPNPGYIDGDAAVCSLYGMAIYLGAESAGIDNVYKTNLPGVGITLYSATNAGGGYLPPAPGILMGSYTHGLYGIYFNHATLVKTGDITSGELTPGQAVKITLNHEGETDGPVVTFTLTSGHVTQVACALKTPALTFPIGNVNASAFGSTVGFTPTQTNTQNLGLECDAGANINVSLNGTQNPDVTETSVLALDSPEGENVATGVGVQLLYNDTPLKINDNIVLKQSAGGQETFPITARYYQTRTNVTAGSANASATLTLTYQ